MSWVFVGYTAVGAAVGSYGHDNWGWEGWLEWEPLPYGRTEVKCDKGSGFGAPFFIVHNEGKGEYLIGHLRWSANWVMGFDVERGAKAEHESLRFDIGPWASDVQRVIGPGETVTTPEVHLGLVAGDFDPTVQARYIRDNIDTFNEMAQAGVPIGDNEFFAALKAGDGGGLSLKNLDVVPGGEAVRNMAAQGGKQTFGEFVI